jgi:hypothetical protein
MDIIFLFFGGSTLLITVVMVGRLLGTIDK